MSAEHDRELQQWASDWQAGAERDISTEEQIRQYVKRRSGLLWSWAVADFVIGVIALPVLAYLGWMARNDVERFAMLSLAGITIAAVGFGWWNWRGVLRSSAASTAEYIAISAERLRRMRLACRIGWAVLVGEVIVLTIWIWDHFQTGAHQHDLADGVFAWGWLVGFSLAAAFSLLWFGRWIARDAARFERLRRELQ
jgi:hypothetical protein